MSRVAKIIGIIIIVTAFIAFVHTTLRYEDATMKLGVNVLTSDVGKKTFEYWIGEGIVIAIGLGILALGIRSCHS